MNQYRWFYKGVVQSIVNGRTMQLWLDLGFETWKTVTVKFNRLQVNVPPLAPGQVFEKTKAQFFLENNLLDKNIFARIFKKKDRNGYSVFYAEIYAYASDIPALDKLKSLREINKALKEDNIKNDELININDLLVKNGLAEITEWSKSFIYDGPPRG